VRHLASKQIGALDGGVEPFQITTTTEAKSMERLLLLQGKLESLGRVAAGIAHEIRNPVYGIAINLKSQFLVTRALINHMIQRGYGRIVNVSSVTGPIVANPDESVYCAAKAGSQCTTTGHVQYAVNQP
jgi:NAD(P)-dependent dehydrogenase (short-subunit alcohol dehydrogenase family)